MNRFILRKIIVFAFILHFTFCFSMTAIGLYTKESQFFQFILFLLGSGCFSYLMTSWALERERLFKKEYIVCSAIWVKNGRTNRFNPSNVIKGYVISGRRHDDCIKILTELDRTEEYKKCTKEQGFITSRNRFIGRQHAAYIAYKAKQIPKKKSTLFSEDLY